MTIPTTAMVLTLLPDGDVDEGATAGSVDEGAAAGGVDEGATAGGVGEGATAGGDCGGNSEVTRGEAAPSSVETTASVEGRE